MSSGVISLKENINDMETKEMIIPQGWEIDKVDDNKILLKKSKKELPKTWKECCELLGRGEFIGVDSDIINIDNTIGKPMLALCKLLVCREVYRQGWKPNWKDGKEIKWTIECIEYRISSMICTYCSKVLSFQSEEIRDKFLENFKDLIEEAKELI